MTHYVVWTVALIALGVVYAVVRGGPMFLGVVAISLLFVPQMRKEKQWLAEWDERHRGGCE